MLKVEVIEYWCRNEMEALGYEVTTKKFDRTKIQGFQEDMSHVTPWLRRYDFSDEREVFWER